MVVGLPTPIGRVGAGSVVQSPPGVPAGRHQSYALWLRVLDIIAEGERGEAYQFTAAP
jgi:hypothetical protein